MQTNTLSDARFCPGSGIEGKTEAAFESSLDVGRSLHNNDIRDLNFNADNTLIFLTYLYLKPILEIDRNNLLFLKLLVSGERVRESARE